MEKKGSIVAVVFMSLLLLLVCGYVGSYVALLTPAHVAVVASTPSGQVLQLERQPAYRIQSQYVVIVFDPAHRVDRLLRPRFWQPSAPMPFKMPME